MITLGKSVLLDTSVVIRHLRAQCSQLANYEELYLPFAALAEMYSGAFRSARPEKNLKQLIHFLEGVDILLPNETTSEIYGHISADLAQKGTPIPHNDIWIAALALQLDLPLATIDKHFQKVTGLTVLLW